MRKSIWLALILALTLGLATVACDKSSDKKDDKTIDDINPGGDEDVATEEDLGEPEQDVAAEEDLDEPDEQVGPPDEENPEVTMGIEPFTAFQGLAELSAEQVSWTDNVAVAKVEVYVDGVLVSEVNLGTNEMDTSTLEVGKYQLSFKVYDAAGHMAKTEEVTVMLAGAGQWMPFEDGFVLPIIPGWSSHQQSVFDFVEELDDTKGHITMPEHQKKAICFSMWDEETTWEMGLDIGTGGCPHQGEKLASEDLAADQGWMEVSYEEEDGSDLTTGTWFAHFRYVDGLEHKGDDIIYHALFWIGQ